MLSLYSFNLYYTKGKDMILSDFLSWLKHDKSESHEIIHIYFDMWEVLNTRYFNIHETEQERYFVLTRFQATTSGTVLPKYMV